MYLINIQKVINTSFFILFTGFAIGQPWNVCNELSAEDCATVDYCALNDAGECDCAWGFGDSGNGYIDWGFGNWDWEEEGYNRSDVTGDGSTDVMDIVNLVNFILDLNSPTNYQFWASDINEDGQLNILDVVLIANQILGLNKFNSNKKTFFNYEIKNNNLQLSGYFIAGFEITSNNDLEIINIITPDEC